MSGFIVPLTRALHRMVHRGPRQRPFRMSLAARETCTYQNRLSGWSALDLPGDPALQPREDFARAQAIYAVFAPQVALRAASAFRGLQALGLVRDEAELHTPASWAPLCDALAGLAEPAGPEDHYGWPGTKAVRPAFRGFLYDTGCLFLTVAERTVPGAAIVFEGDHMSGSPTRHTPTIPHPVLRDAQGQLLDPISEFVWIGHGFEHRSGSWTFAALMLGALVEGPPPTPVEDTLKRDFEAAISEGQDPRTAFAELAVDMRLAPEDLPEDLLRRAGIDPKEVR